MSSSNIPVINIQVFKGTKYLKPYNTVIHLQSWNAHLKTTWEAKSVKTC